MGKKEKGGKIVRELHTHEKKENERNLLEKKYNERRREKLKKSRIKEGRGIGGVRR